VIPLDGPFPDQDGVLRGIQGALGTARNALRPPVPEALGGWFALNERVLCESLAAPGVECRTE